METTFAPEVILSWRMAVIATRGRLNAFGIIIAQELTLVLSSNMAHKGYAATQSTLIVDALYFTVLYCTILGLLNMGTKVHSEL